MRYKPSIETDLEILDLLGTEKEYPQYDMKKRLEKTYRTILRHTKQLEKKHLIKVNRREESEKKGKERKIYTLTINGVFFLLANKENPQDMDAIIANYRELLPMFFGKWEFFMGQGLKEWAYDHLIAMVTFPVYRKDATTLPPDEFEECIREELNKNVFNVEFYPEKYKGNLAFKKQLARLEKLRKDPDLANLIEKQLRKEAKEIEEYYQGSKWWIAWWDSKEK